MLLRGRPLESLSGFVGVDIRRSEIEVAEQILSLGTTSASGTAKKILGALVFSALNRFARRSLNLSHTIPSKMPNRNQVFQELLLILPK